MSEAAVVPSIANGTSKDDQQTSAREFLLLCAPTQAGDTLSEAVHALYYLPQNYKLVVPADMAVSEEAKAAIRENIAIMDRIRFADNTGKAAEASPFSVADVVIDNLATDTITVHSSSNQSVVIPVDSPEALASAVMGIARAQA